MLEYYDDLVDLNVKEKIETIQDLLVAHSTGSRQAQPAYAFLREQILTSPMARLLPDFVRRCRNLDQFWSFIKKKFGTYQERREFIWDAFRPALDAAEKGGLTPSDELVGDVLSSLSSDAVKETWHRALQRRAEDPEGAITLARTLLETVCKNILDELEVEWPLDADLPKLYHLASTSLNIAPSLHTEKAFKQILGGCTAVVHGLGTLRNRLSDAHGKGRKPVRPAPRHAELAVNLAGAMAMFLVSTWDARSAAAA